MDSMTTTTVPTNHTAAGIRIGSVVFNAADPNRNHESAYRSVCADPAYIKLQADEFCILSYAGYLTIGRLTGRTRKCWGIDCPTIERFEVTTFADSDGVIWGDRGDRIPGTSDIRPENVWVG